MRNYASAGAVLNDFLVGYNAFTRPTKKKGKGTGIQRSAALGHIEIGILQSEKKAGRVTPRPALDIAPVPQTLPTMYSIARTNAAPGPATMPEPWTSNS